VALAATGPRTSRPADVEGRLIPWAREVSDESAMVENWDQLGVVIQTASPTGQPVFIKSERCLGEPDG
jgi:hypothetical protein